MDYPQNIGLPAFQFYANQRTAYLRLHWRNPNWWQAQSAQKRHDYRYNNVELQDLATLLNQHKSVFGGIWI